MQIPESSHGSPEDGKKDRLKGVRLVGSRVTRHILNLCSRNEGLQLLSSARPYKGDYIGEQAGSVHVRQRF